MEYSLTTQIFQSESEKEAWEIYNSPDFQKGYEMYIEDVNYYNQFFDTNYEVYDIKKLINNMYGSGDESK